MWNSDTYHDVSNEVDFRHLGKYIANIGKGFVKVLIVEYSLKTYFFIFYIRIEKRGCINFENCKWTCFAHSPQFHSFA